MSVGGSSNLGTILIKRLDTAHSVLASQQSQLAHSSRAHAVAQLADAARVDPVHNQINRLPDTIERAQAQTRQARQTADTAELKQRHVTRTERPTTETQSTPSAPTTLGRAARTILALLALFPDQAPPVRGRAPLLPPGAATAHGSAAGASGSAPSGASLGTPAGAANTAGTASSSAGASNAGSVPVSSAPASVSGAPSTGETQSTLPTTFARSLATALQQSGVFYESHLRDWMTGNRSLTQLQQEPQALLHRPAATTQPAHNAPAVSTGSNSVAPAPTDSPPSDTRSTIGTSATNQHANATPTSSNPIQGVHPDSQPVVRQQLEVLATQVFGWRGEAWPDAPMEWEISRRNNEGAADETGTHWATKLSLELPTLGKVEARLSLLDSQVVLQLTAPESADTLSEHDQALRAAFSQAGLTLSQLSIQEQS